MALNPPVSETVIAIVVPEAEPAVDLIQRQHTLAGAQGMPVHLTLLSPFTDTDLLAAGRANQARAVLEPFAPFNFELAEFRRFKSEAETVLWLAPEPSEPFVAMTEALVAEFPEHKPYGGKFDQIIPHLTVAVDADSELLDQIEDEVVPALPIRAHATQAGIYEHAASGWRLHSPFDFSG
jgi:2'-5' RNA ligase